MKELIFFPNGNVAVLDESGEQVPELQGSYIEKYLEFLEEKKGVNINDLKVLTSDWKVAIPVRTKNGIVLRFVDALQKIKTV